MPLKNSNPTQTTSWKKLQEHYHTIKDQPIKQFFSVDATRTQNLSITWQDFYIDYSKNHITNETLSLLLDLANEVDLQDAITKQFSGDLINQTEKRPVLHTALRAKKPDKIFVNGKNIIPQVHQAKDKIKKFSEAIISGKKRGFSGKPFTHIVNIGIGGSHLGPKLVVEALQYYKNHLKLHFISNIDGDHIHETLKNLHPETTLFIITSKTFTTQETITNAKTVKKWFLQHTSEENFKKHFVAVSANKEKVTQFGIDKANIFPMWNWVGGRFSLWSSVGLPISLAIGFTNFDELLTGANKMDTHFKTADFKQNIPVILALISVWYTNFFNVGTEAIISYTQYLKSLPSYLQQLVMESNGKSVDRNRNLITYQTANIIWGATGTDAQHAFFQLMHQGTKTIPADFIGFSKSLYEDEEHHQKLMANFFAQTQALLQGKTKHDIQKALAAQNLSTQEIEKLLPFKICSGNKPTNTLLIEKLTPESLGKLIAIYEHKTFVQGIIWNIYSYDQWGVEIGKQFANKLLKR